MYVYTYMHTHTQGFFFKLLSNIPVLLCVWVCERFMYLKGRVTGRDRDLHICWFTAQMPLAVGAASDKAWSWKFHLFSIMADGYPSAVATICCFSGCALAGFEVRSRPTESAVWVAGVLSRGSKPVAPVQILIRLCEGSQGVRWVSLSTCLLLDSENACCPVLGT